MRSEYGPITEHMVVTMENATETEKDKHCQVGLFYCIDNKIGMLVEIETLKRSGCCTMFVFTYWSELGLHYKDYTMYKSQAI